MKIQVENQKMKIDGGVWFALTQINTLWEIGFNEFEIYQGWKGPVGTLHSVRFARKWMGIRK